MQVTVLWENQPCGSLWAEQRGLYTVFQCEVETDQVCRLCAVYEGGETPLGVPAPERGKMRLCVSIPTGRLPRGKLLRGELRPKHSAWQAYAGGPMGEVTLPPGLKQGDAFRFRWKPGEPLPCPELFCFFRFVREGGRCFLEIRFNEEGRPVV